MVAMSGGVDSSVAAALMKQRGFSVTGVFMALGQTGGEEFAAEAGRVADFLEIPLRILKLAREFEQNVLNYFSESYLQGKTPNPCIVCNRSIKFGRLLDFALAASFDYLATGHYVRIVSGPDGTVRLLQGLDSGKDQSYFLCQLAQEQLARIIFPLGEITKNEVRRLAADLGLQVVHSAESQDICFMQGKKLRDFFVGHNISGAGHGRIVTMEGEKKGTHSGINNYTLGQRRGLGVPGPYPYYVVRLDPLRNKVIIGREEDLWHDRLIVQNMNWLAGRPPALPGNFLVKIRYRHQGAPAKVAWAGPDITVTFNKPQRAITPGQFAVLYKGEEVVGGGEIVLNKGNYSA